MQPVEAMTLLIANADDRLSLSRLVQSAGEEMSEGGQQEYEKLEIAASVATTMLNTALPVARFRCFVQVTTTKTKYEYTICAVSLDDIKGGLAGLMLSREEVYVQLWEQKRESANMVCGYQGPSKIPRYRDWVKTMHNYLESEK